MKLFFRIFFKLVQAIVGPVLLLGDWLTTPKGIKRPDAEQQAVDVRTQKLALYQFKACPFCIKARRAIKRLSLNIQTRDALRDARHRQDLLCFRSRHLNPHTLTDDPLVGCDIDANFKHV